ncbi:MAG: putative RpiR-family transcriptional regulator [Frondihabitans sp.]|nr:putative RpiR-family transcriptional regulator [Frondihabitans sp.]
MSEKFVTKSSAERLGELVRNVHLTPTQRSIVRTLLANIEQAQYLSTTDVAELAHVSQPSVTRLAIALGFKGYPQLRAVLREPAEAAPADGAPTNDWQRSIDFEIAALGQIRDAVRDETQIRRIATELMGSRPLIVAGHRAATSLAQYFTYFASRIHDDVRTLPMKASGAGADIDVLHQARAAGATAALVMVFPRYAEESMTLIRSAHKLGLRVVGVTDTVVSPIASEVDELLIAPVDSSLLFDSYASPMIVLNVLLAAMAEIDPDDTQRRLEKFDAIAAQFGIFHKQQAAHPLSA